MTSTTAESPSVRWYQGLDRYCWIVLAIAALGWLFDTMDQNLFNLVRVPSVTDLLRSHFTDKALLDAAVKENGAIVQAVFLIGWSCGGFIFGIIGDRLGRTTTMMLTILIYALFTGLSGSPIVHDIPTYAAMRFMTALGVGGEWAAGAALVAEVFPARSRAMALGTLQSLSGLGNMTAALITLNIDTATSWRLVYFIGAVPALVVLWIRTSVKEPEKWKEAKAQASLGQELGNIGELFSHPVLRRNTIAAVLMAAAGVGALWGVGFFSPDLLRQELLHAGITGRPAQFRISLMFLVQNFGAIFGALAFAALAERTTRKLAFYVFFALAWVSILALFWGVAGSGEQAFTRAMILAPIMGFCTLGPFSGYTLYFPELFPTRLRTTGCGFGYNAARILAAGAPFALGKLTVALGGFAPAASVVSGVLLLGFVGTAIGPETKGKPLPE